MIPTWVLAALAQARSMIDLTHVEIEGVALKYSIRPLRHQRCVVCGRLPSEGCNDKTHAAHDRMWLDIPNPPMVVDASALKKRRIEKAWSQERVSAALGVHSTSVGKWETGTAPTIRTQYAWRDLLTKDT